MNYRRDISDQYADANDAALNEVYADRDDWADDDRPTRNEIERDEYGPDYFDERERWRSHADNH